MYIISSGAELKLQAIDMGGSLDTDLEKCGVELKLQAIDMGGSPCTTHCRVVLPPDVTV